MKRLAFLLALFCTLAAHAQTWQKVNGRWQYQFLKSDSTFTPPQDTLSLAPIGSIAVKNDVVYFKNAAGHWISLVGLSINIATASLTATGNYTQHWTNHNLNFDSVAFYGVTGYGSYFGGPQRVQYNFVPNSFSQALTIAHTIRNAADNSDSAMRSIVFSAAGINESTTASGKTSSIILGDNAAGQTVTIMGADSTYIGKAIAKATADSVFAVGPLQNSGKTNVLYKVPVSGLSGKNLATAALTATGDYTHNWANHNLFIDTLKGWQFKYYTDGTGGYAGRKRLGYYQFATNTGHFWYDDLRNVANTTDSLSIVMQAKPEFFTVQTASGFNTTSNFFVTSGLIQQQAIRGVKQGGVYIYPDSVVASIDSNSINKPLILRLRNLPTAGNYIYNLAVNSSGDVIAAKNSVAACSVKDNGADTTGTIDASSIVQDMVNAGCKNIKFPAGHYLLTNTVQLKDSITITGDGKSTVIHLTQNKPGFRCGFTNGQWCTFKDFAIAGTYNIDSVSQEGFRIDSCKGILFSNVYFFKTSGYAIHFYKNKSSTESNMVTHCYFDSCRRGPWAESEFNKFTNNIIAYCDTGLKISHGNNTVNDNHITKGSIGIYLYGYLAGGEFNDGHTEVRGNLIAHNFFAGLYVNGVQNGEQFGGNIIRNNSVYDVYAQNSDQLWFDNCDLGVDSLVFINCTNTNITPTCKIWDRVPGRPVPADQFTAWRVVGEAPTIIGTGWVHNAISIYDVINNKTYSIKHTNNIVDLSTTNTGKIRALNDTIVAPVFSGSETYNGNVHIYGSSNRTPTSSGTVYIGNNFVAIDSVSANKEPMLGIGQTSYRGYMVDLQLKRRGIAWYHAENDSSSTLSGAGFRMGPLASGHRSDIYFTDAAFTNGAPGDALVLYSAAAVNGVKIVADAGPIEIAGAQAVNTLSYAKWFVGGNFSINSITDNGHKLQVNGAQTLNKDSVPIIQTPTTQYQVLIDTTTGQIERKSLRQLFTQTADVSVSGTNSETTLVGSGTGTLTIPANYLTAGKSYRVTLRGKYSTDASNPAQMNWKVKLGGTVIAASGNAGLGTNKTDKGYDIHCEFTCRTTGSSGTVMAQGMFFTEDGPGAKNMTNGFATTTINTTVSNTVDVTVTLTDSSAGNSCYAYTLILEEI